MALTKLRKTIPPRRDAVAVTLTYMDEELRFSRPRVGDLQPSRDQLEEIGRNYSGLRPDQLLYVHILGRGYIPDVGEGEMVAWKEFAGIAQENDLAFSDLVRQWELAFPEFTDWATARFSAKNDSRAQEDSDTKSPTLPPVLDAPQES